MGKRKEKKKNRTDARSVRRLPRIRAHRKFRVRSRVAARRGSVTRIHSRNNRASFLSHCYRRNSHEIVPDFVIKPIVDVSPLLGAACAPVCARRGSRRVHVHASRQFYGANIIAAWYGTVSFPAKHARARVRVREHFLRASPSRPLCTANGRDCSLFRRFSVTGL